MIEFPERYDVWNYASSLSFLASDAAVDLDNASSGRIVDYSNVKKLAGILRNEAHMSKETERMHPVTIVVLYNALLTYNYTQKTGSNQERITKKEEVISHIEVLAEELQIAERLPKKRLQDLASFCVALSRRTLAFQQEYIYRRQLVA